MERERWIERKGLTLERIAEAQQRMQQQWDVISRGKEVVEQGKEALDRQRRLQL